MPCLGADPRPRARAGQDPPGATRIGRAGSWAPLQTARFLGDPGAPGIFVKYVGQKADEKASEGMVPRANEGRAMASSIKTVTQGNWSVSTETSSAEPGVATLSVFILRQELTNRWGGKGRFQYGDAHGKRFTAKTSREASDQAFAYALEHGYLVPWYPRAVAVTVEAILRRA